MQLNKNSKIFLKTWLFEGIDPPRPCQSCPGEKISMKSCPERPPKHFGVHIFRNQRKNHCFSSFSRPGQTHAKLPCYFFATVMVESYSIVILYEAMHLCISYITLWVRFFHAFLRHPFWNPQRDRNAQRGGAAGPPGKILNLILFYFCMFLYCLLLLYRKQLYRKKNFMS